MKKKKAAVFILLGQSNAVGHGIPMEEDDKILSPLKNVYGLHRQDNQSLGNKTLVWRGYTSDGMNLGETQDHTYSLANCLAAQWQQRIDAGQDLPDLYIVHMAIGAQGVTRGYMWYPQREKKLLPGVLGTADIALFPFSVHIFSLLEKSFCDMGKEFEMLGLHWRGGENDVTEEQAYLRDNLADIYRRIFGTFNDLLKKPPIVIHEIHCPDRMNDLDPTGNYLENMHYINSVFRILESEFENISLFDVRNAPFYTPEGREKGIFVSDAIHYTPETNQWTAQCLIERYIKSRDG